MWPLLDYFHPLYIHIVLPQFRPHKDTRFFSNFMLFCPPRSQNRIWSSIQLCAHRQMHGNQWSQTFITSHSHTQIPPQSQYVWLEVVENGCRYLYILGLPTSIIRLYPSSCIFLQTKLWGRTSLFQSRFRTLNIIIQQTHLLLHKLFIILWQWVVRLFNLVAFVSK